MKARLGCMCTQMTSEKCYKVCLVQVVMVSN